LMDEWCMPDEIRAVVGYHHDPGYQGDHADYVWLTQVTDQLLKQHDLSDADTDELSLSLYQRLGLSEEQLNTALDDVLQCEDVLDAMVHSLMN
ncbi:MAG: hypothetical protein WD601_14390, partial [Pseudohongiellaceae bacterium]